MYRGTRADAAAGDDAAAADADDVCVYRGTRIVGLTDGATVVVVVVARVVVGAARDDDDDVR